MVKNNGLAVLAYLFGIIGGIVIYLVADKRDRLLRFHALQSILFNIAAGIIWAILFALTVPFHLISQGAWFAVAGAGIVLGAYGVILFIVWIILMVKAYENKKWKLPLIGEWAEDWSR